MRRVSASYSPHIATNVHELCHKSFGQNCSTSSTRYVHDIHGDISVGSCEPIRVYTTFVQVLRYVYEIHTTPCDISTSSFYTTTRESLRFNTIYYEMLRYLYEISTTSCDSIRLSTISHDFCTTSNVFWNKE